MLKILIAEDEEPIANLIKMNLRRAGYQCEWAPDGEQAADMMDHEKFDLLLLDIMLPGINGYELMDYAKTLELPVIFLTALGSVDNKVKGLKMGADDYLTKPFGMMEMVSRIRAVLRRSRPKEEIRILRIGSLELNLEGHTVSVGGSRVLLTLKEFEILRLLMDNPGRVFTREQLLQSVWGASYMGETRTIDVHIGTLRAKLGCCGDYIETVRGVGYRMEG